MQKVIFWLLKGDLLQGKRLHFIKHWETRTYEAVQHTSTREAQWSVKCAASGRQLLTENNHKCRSDELIRMF